MSKELKIILCLVMAAAFALIFVCGLNYLSLTKELHSCEQQLAERSGAFISPCGPPSRAFIGSKSPTR